MTDLAAALMADHYDPAYAKSRQKIGARTAATVTTDTLDAAGSRHRRRQAGRGHRPSLEHRDPRWPFR